MKNKKKIIFIIMAIGIYIFKPVYYTYLFSYLKKIIDIINAGVEETDPNWLFATYAQSTAAIVAILGGFIVSRILSLSAQKNNIKAEIEDINIEITSKKEEYNKEKAKVIKRNIKLDFNLVQFKKIVNQIDEFDIWEYLNERLKSRWFRILNNYLIKDLESQELYPYYNEIYKLIKKADQYLCEDYSLNIINKIGNDTTLTYNEKAIYKCINKISNGNNPNTYPITNILDYLNLNDIEIEIRDRGGYNNVLNNLNRLKIEYNLLNTRKEKLLHKIKNFRNLKDLKTGIYVFAYFTLVGLIIPVLFIPMKISDFTLMIKWFIFFLFSSGVFSVLGYIVWSVKKITETDNDFLDKHN